MSNFNRKDFLKMGALSAFYLPILGSACTASLGKKKPNILFIYVDDMGYGDLSSYGNGEIETPNIDRIANEGIKFTNYYSSSPICSPSRVALTTGQYPAKWKIHSFLATRERNSRRGMDDYLSLEAPSLAKVFKSSGYRTAHFGKWHMGGGRDVDDAPHPKEYGFDTSLVSFEGLGDRLLQKNHLLSNASAKLGQGKIEWVEKWKFSGRYVDETIKFIEQDTEAPFFVQLWTGDVHDPFLPKEEWKGEFEQFANDKYKRDFYAVLNNLDKQIGRVLDKLDELKFTENTLVVFASDNGPTDWPRYYAEGYNPPGSSGPYRGRKWSLYEGGIRMPMMARLPGVIPKGKTDSHTVMHACDWFPTLCSMAQISKPEATFDGMDMSVALTERPIERGEPVFWEYGRDEFDLNPGNELFRSPNLAVREGEWKLLINRDGSAVELYNLNTDQAETNDVAEKNPEIKKLLTKKVMEWSISLPS